MLPNHVDAHDFRTMAVGNSLSDIFISYARQDRPRAEAFAKALEAHGWSVWWDRSIPAGKTFRQVIQEQLDQARCVIVPFWRIFASPSEQERLIAYKPNTHHPQPNTHNPTPITR